MSTSISLPWRGARERARPAVGVLRRPELLVLLILAAVLNLWALGRNGLANEYYAGAVRSMSASWHAFLYGSFDSAGVMTVDKPPLALWVQAAFVKVFGFSSWSMLVPQALMGVATVGLTYDLVRRRFGRGAGFAAGLVLALTPIAVAMARHNNPDMLLTLCVTGAVWAVVRALEDGRTRWLIVAGVAVGLGFETKMAAALLVVPALVAAYLWVAPRGRATAVGQLALGGAAMTVVGLAWPVLVWLTPADSRPWVSGTSDNSVWSLIFGYNGLGRLLGQEGGPGGGAGPGAGVFGGEPGPLRLLNSALGGQAGWLLGFAVVAGLAVLIATRLRRDDARTGWLIAVGGAFLTTAVAYSAAEGIFHPYYVVALAPFTAALVGAGVRTLADSGLTARVLAPAAILAGVVCELVVLDGTLPWVPAVLVIAGVGAAVALGTSLDRQIRAVALSVALGALLLAPGAWAVDTLGHAASGTFPAGGPETAATAGGPGGAGPGGFGPGGGGPGFGGGAAPPGLGGGPMGGAPFGGQSQTLTEAVDWVEANGGGTIAVDAQNGAGSIVAEGADVAAIGGFSGRESQVTLDWLADAVESGRIRYVLANGGGTLPFDGRVGSQDVLAVAEQVGTPVSAVDGLYDLQGLADALRAAG
jgi:4-amino-4-deoxy-L-arabinose transferase-like glycosyltransferase